MQAIYMHGGAPTTSLGGSVAICEPEAARAWLIRLGLLFFILLSVLGLGEATVCILALGKLEHGQC